jgi:predicted HicB family RNase H-like nuclease
MTQWTIRVPEKLAGQVRATAEAAGRSVNGWVTSVLSAAVDPDLAGDEAQRVRERLRQAGLLYEPPRRRIRRPSPEEIAEARRAAARGKSLSEYVSEDRG